MIRFRRPLLWSLTALLALFGSGVDIQAHSATDCFDRINRETRLDDTVSVFITDGSVILVRPPVMLVASSLYLRLASDSIAAGHTLVPFEQIDYISYCKPGWQHRGLTFLGLAIGSTAGAVIGVSLAPESSSEHWLDFSNEWSYGILGGIIGGVLGAVGGDSLGKHFTTIVKLKCR